MTAITKRIASAAILAFAVCQPVHAQVNWTDWTTATQGTTTGSAEGSLNGITVSYSGEVLFNTQVSSTNLAGGASTNYWVGGQTGAESPYVSDTVPNAPPAFDVITLQGGPLTGLNTITFSQAVTNPIMAILSLGRETLPGLYDFAFNQDFVILSSGRGHFGGNPDGSLVEAPGNLLLGIEGHGTIMFPGTHTSISWMANPTEFWHGFQIAVIPEPESYAMLLAGLGLLGFMARRRKTALGRFAV